VRGNVIEWVGRVAELPAALSTADTVLELRDHVMIPGMPRRPSAIAFSERAAACLVIDRVVSFSLRYSACRRMYGQPDFVGNLVLVQSWKHGVALIICHPVQAYGWRLLCMTAADTRYIMWCAGLINTHHHMFQALTRCIAQDQKLFGWLKAMYAGWQHIKVLMALWLPSHTRGESRR